MRFGFGRRHGELREGRRLCGGPQAPLGHLAQAVEAP